MNCLYKKFATVGFVALMSTGLSGCFVIPVALNLGAEVFSVVTTDKTITENLKEAIMESKKEKKEKVEVARMAAPIPPRKPTPVKVVDTLVINAPVMTFGSFVNN